MKTEILRLDGSASDDSKIRTAARAVRDGKLVAFPTETVYGLATNADDAAAVRRLSDVKRRDPSKPYALMIPDEGHVEKYIGQVPDLAHKLMRIFWPGPLTIVVRVQDGRTVGLRLPDHPVARALVAWAGCPVAAPSANRSGAEPPSTAEEVLQQLGKEIDVVLDGGPAHRGLSSTVALVREHEVEVLREGPVTEEEILAARAYQVLFVCSGNSCRSPMAQALLEGILKERRGRFPRGRQGRSYRVSSAGTGVMSEGNVNELAAQAMAEVDLDISGHRTTPLSMSMISAADKIYTMTDRHRMTILEMVPEARDRVERLDPSEDIMDPAGSDIEAYRECRDRIATLVERIAVKT
ncbi:MAG: L-threonylcarbamoyladenylate synthase [Planctomycetota bacterium]|jgi:tRNA threonylcarbamoyl adenosine modification protein (Sua5/YciO/YrdC/YwlC family)